MSAPADGDEVGASVKTVEVRGTVSPSDATVQVAGKPAEVQGGLFTANVPVKPGDNTLDVAATAPGADAVTETVKLVRKEQVAVKPKTKPKAAQAEGPPAEDSGGGTITVPNVVGKDHQLAQDTMQEAGLYSLQEEDATGQGRLLLYDRNWTTVKQDPPAGSKVGPDETITLYAKKDGE